MSGRLRTKPLSRVFVTTDAVGGVWRYALELAAGCDDRGLAVTLAVLGPALSLAQRREAAGLDVIETGLPLDWLAAGEDEIAGAASALATLARDADAVHLHTPSLADACWPAPVVAVAHSCVASWWDAVRGGPLPEDFAWRTEGIRRGLQAADAVIAPSRAFAASLAALYDIPSPIVVHNGRRPPPVTPSQSPRQGVLTAGRLWDEGKNAAALDGAAARLGCRVEAAGPVRGPHGGTATLPHLALLGTLEETGLAHRMACARVFASLAFYEPFGLAVLEAAQAGCALVLSDIATFRELWDGAACFVPQSDPGALDAALAGLLRDDELCAAAGKQARNRAARYSVQNMVDGTLAVHRSLSRRVGYAA